MWSIILFVVLSLGVLSVLFTQLYRITYNQYRFGVPFIRSKNQWIEALLNNLKLQKGDLFLDLGCGDGIVMANVLEQFPHTQTIWYELSNTPILASEAYKKQFGSQFIIHQSDFFKADFSNANVIYCYLLPRLIKPVREKIKKECKPWTIFYSYVFIVPWITPEETLTIPIPNRKNDILYKYRVT